MNIKKIISLLLVLCMALSMFTTVALAENVSSDIDHGGDGNNPNTTITVPEPTVPGGTDGIVGIGNTVLGYIQWLGYAIAVGMLIWCGVKYMMSGAGEKADVKKTLLPYFIGAICVGGATVIAGIVLDIGGGL